MRENIFNTEFAEAEVRIIAGAGEEFRGPDGSIWEAKWDKNPANGRERQIERLQLKAYQEGHRLANAQQPPLSRQHRRWLAGKAPK